MEEDIAKIISVVKGDANSSSTNTNIVIATVSSRNSLRIKINGIEIYHNQIIINELLLQNNDYINSLKIGDKVACTQIKDKFLVFCKVFEL